MRLALTMTLLVLLAGCSDPGQDASQEDAAADAAAGSTARLDTAEMPQTPETTPVQDAVSFSGLIGAGACFFDGTGISCANLPSLTPPSTGASFNVLMYHHARTAAAFDGGALEVAWSPHVGQGLSAHVSVYSGCPDACELVEQIARGGSSLDDAGVSTEAGFAIEVPAYALEAGQTLGVRIAPLLITGLASAHTGYDVDLTGALDFQVVA